MRAVVTIKLSLICSTHYKILLAGASSEGLKKCIAVSCGFTGSENCPILTQSSGK